MPVGSSHVGSHVLEKGQPGTLEAAVKQEPKQQLPTVGPEEAQQQLSQLAAQHLQNLLAHQKRQPIPADVQQLVTALQGA